MFPNREMLSIIEFWDFGRWERQTCHEPWADIPGTLSQPSVRGVFRNRQLQPSRVFLKKKEELRELSTFLRPWLQEHNVNNLVILHAAKLLATPPRENITKIIRPEYVCVISGGGYGKIA